jgi:hypothetical protein
MFGTEKLIQGETHPNTLTLMNNVVVLCNAQATRIQQARPVPPSPTIGLAYYSNAKRFLAVNVLGNLLVWHSLHSAYREWAFSY